MAVLIMISVFPAYAEVNENSTVVNPSGLDINPSTIGLKTQKTDSFSTEVPDTDSLKPNKSYVLLRYVKLLLAPIILLVPIIILIVFLIKWMRAENKKEWFKRNFLKYLIWAGIVFVIGYAIWYFTILAPVWMYNRSLS